MGKGQRRRVLVSVDESDESTYALEWALEHLIQPQLHSNGDEDSELNDTVILLHAQPMPQVYPTAPAGPGLQTGLFVTPEVTDSLRHYQDNVSRNILSKAKELCNACHVQAVSRVETGDARDVICGGVEKEKADLLVMGSRGYGGIKRTFMGSVSDYCVRQAKCPVLIVRKTWLTSHSKFNVHRNR